MGRQDIQINTDYGDFETIDNIVGRTYYEFIYLDRIDGLDNDNYCYGEIVVPRDFEQRTKNNIHIYTHLPYKPINKELRIRLRINSQSVLPDFILNRNNNTEWYKVTLPNDNKIRFSEYHTLGNSDIFNLVPDGGTFHLYSGQETDLLIKPSLGQNQNFLLKASAGTLYQHPLTGVGLIDFLHGNFENSGLAAKLKNEFESDDMIVINAYMNTETGELLLEVKEKNG